MRHYKLTAPQAAATGFTDVFALRTKDGDFVRNAATVVVLDALAIGDIVMRTYMETQTLVDSAGACATKIGVTGTDDLFIASTSTKAAAHIAAIASVTPYPATGAINLLATNTVADNAITVGEVWVWMEIRREGERPVVGDL